MVVGELEFLVWIYTVQILSKKLIINIFILSPPKKSNVVINSETMQSNPLLDLICSFRQEITQILIQE